MRGWAMGLTVVLALLCAQPAGGNPVPNDPLNDEGTLSGAMWVGKFRDFCTHDGFSHVTGAGLGMPWHNAVWNERKIAYFHLSASVINVKSVPGFPTGHLRACGTLLPVGDNLGGQPGNGVGAACGMSKGHNGKGLIEFPFKPPPGDAIWLDQLGWKFTTGGMMLVSGEAYVGPPKTKDDDRSGFQAVISAQGAAPCLTKTGADLDKSGGAREFTVAGVYALGGPPFDRNLPLIDLDGDGLEDGMACKQTGEMVCLYQDKPPYEKDEGD